MQVTGAYLTRRGLIHAGCVAPLGFGLPELLQAESSTREPRQIKSCIFIFLYGGPSQLDTFDLKPHAPAEIRGEFRPVPTSVPGTHVCEHLPRTAKLAHHYAIVRSLYHTNRNHSPASGWVLTGSNPNTDGDPKRPPGPEDPPALGALAARLAPSRSGVPGYVHLPARLYFDAGLFFRGQAGGWLGTAYDPLLIQQDPSSPNFRMVEFALPEDMPIDRLSRRVQLLSRIDRPMSSAAQPMDDYHRRAFDILISRAGQTAFDLEKEPDRVRDRYGSTMLGQSCLLARRLVEAGTRLVTVADCFPSGENRWDTHRKNFDFLKNRNLPALDRAFSGLLEDLSERGLLEDTVVYVGGEFGRTPKIGQSSGSGSEPDGRDHWPQCFSGILAGGGVQNGSVYGASDKFAACPVDSPLTPEDLAATLLTAMGLDPATILVSRENRPMPVNLGKVARGLLR